MPNSDAPDNLERLFQQAEAKAAAEAPATPSEPSPQNGAAEPEPEPPCDHTGSDVHTRRWCRQCKRLMCQFCWSVTDPNYCQQCMYKVKLDVTEGIVTGDDGVEHRGRVLTPTPEFNQLRWIPNGKTTAQTLHEMSEDEIYEYIRSYQQMLSDAEHAVDIARARLSAGTLHLDEVKAQKRRSLQGQPLPAMHSVGVNPRTGRQAQPRPSVAKAKAPKGAPAFDVNAMAAAIAALGQMVNARTKGKP